MSVCRKRSPFPTRSCAPCNGLENALFAVSQADTPDRWVSLYCGVKHNQLLMEIKNPYTGSIPMADGLPVATEPGHGYGCRSIRSIVLNHRGLYSFEPKDGIFTLQIALPLLPM